MLRAARGEVKPVLLASKINMMQVRKLQLVCCYVDFDRVPVPVPTDLLAYCASAPTFRMLCRRQRMRRQSYGTMGPRSARLAS